MNVNDYVSINRAILKLVGLYPVSTVRYLICTVCILLIVVPQMIQIYQKWQDLTIVLETSSVLLTIVLAILKSTVWIFNRKSLQSVIDFMLTDYWELVEKTSAYDHLQIYATYGRKVTKGYLFLICNALVFFFSLPFIDLIVAIIKGTADNSVRRFPFVALYPDAYYDFPLYEIVYISQMVATSVCGLVIFATDTLMATALFHTCGHFKILRENLKQLDSSFRSMNNSEIKSKNSNTHLQAIKLQIAQIIRHHQVVLWFCDKMERNFNPMLLLQTLASSLIICLVGLQVSTTLTEKTKLIKYSSYLAMALFQLLMFCFPGDILIHQSSSVSKAVYSMRWYELPVPIKTEVCMITLRSQKPSYVTAGKFYIMHLENFTTILSTALSYFMLLRSFSADGA